MHLQNPWGLLALLAIPAILILYLLKRRHPEQVVPSLFLWNRTVSQSQAARPWQKLKKSLLLFLQLAMAAVLAFALADPVIAGREKTVAGIYVLDTSLSMSATDEEPTRLEAAKAAIAESVRQAPAGTPLSLVVMGASARIEASGLTDKNQFLSVLSGVTGENAGADLEGALTMATLLQEQTGGQVAFYTDTVYDYEDLSCQTNWFGNNGDNWAVTLLSLTEPAADGTVTALVKVRSFGSESATRTLTVYGDDVALDVQEVTLAAGEEKDVYFSGLSGTANTYLASLSAGDVLGADDSRTAVQNTSTEKRVLLVTDSNIFLEKALGLMDGVTVHTSSVAGEADTGFDLYVYDGIFPETFPTDGALLLIQPENNALFSVGGSVAVSEPLIRDASYFGGRTQAGFAIAQSQSLTTPVWADTILDSAETDLIFAGETEGQRVAVIGFDLHDSDLPLQVEFPMLTAQLISFFFPEAVENQSGLIAGQAISFSLRPDSVKVTATTPSGQTISLAPPFPADSLTQTTEVGMYLLTQENAEGETTVSRFAVNPVTTESDLKREAAEEETVSAGEAVAGSVSLQVPLLLIVLALLALEWWVNCRVR